MLIKVVKCLQYQIQSNTTVAAHCQIIIHSLCQLRHTYSVAFNILQGVTNGYDRSRKKLWIASEALDVYKKNYFSSNMFTYLKWYGIRKSVVLQMLHRSDKIQRTLIVVSAFQLFWSTLHIYDENPSTEYRAKSSKNVFCKIFENFYVQAVPLHSWYVAQCMKLYIELQMDKLELIGSYKSPTKLSAT